MKNFSELYKSLNHLRLVFLLAPVLLAIGVSAITGCASRPEAQLMFVQSAEDVEVDPAKKTLRLVKVNQQVLFFSDRPVRMAGHYTMPEYLDTWRQGKDSFAQDPPNATLSVYEPGRKEQLLVVITISNPVVDGADLLYTYKVIDGAMPTSGGATALFIDWIPARPGAGAGGVGRPGVGAGGVGGPGVGGPRGVGW
jgi:hypothetical protein